MRPHQIFLMAVESHRMGIWKSVTEKIRRAQDHSVSADDGVARRLSLITGWGTSYPEAKGYMQAILLTLQVDFKKLVVDDNAAPYTEVVPAG